MELSPDYSWAYFNIAQIYWELDRVDDAIVMLKKALEKNPKDSEAVKLIVQIYIQQEKIEEALELLTEFTKNNENADAYYLMSRIFEIMGDDSSRKDCLELALEYQKTLTFNLETIRKEYREIVK